MYWLCLHFIVVCFDVVTFSIDIMRIQYRYNAQTALVKLIEKIRGPSGTIRARTSVHNSPTLFRFSV